MGIVTISGISYSRSTEIARTLAEKLDHEYLDDRQLFEQTSSRFGVSFAQLEKACRDAPSLLGMSPATRRRLLALAQATLSARFLAGNVVHRGRFGHLLVQGVAHLFRVRVRADLDDRIARRVERDGGEPREADKFIRRDDKQRLAIARQFFDVDHDDPALFDLVVDTSKVGLDEAVTTIDATSRQKRYQPTTYSLACLKNVELGHRVRAALIDLDPYIDAHAENGHVRVRTRDMGRGTRKRVETIQERAAALDGVDQVEVTTIRNLYDGTPRTLK